MKGSVTRALAYFLPPLFAACARGGWVAHGGDRGPRHLAGKKLRSAVASVPFQGCVEILERETKGTHPMLFQCESTGQSSSRTLAISPVGARIKARSHGLKSLSSSQQKATTICSFKNSTPGACSSKKWPFICNCVSLDKCLTSRQNLQLDALW